MKGVNRFIFHIYQFSVPVWQVQIKKRNMQIEECNFFDFRYNSFSPKELKRKNSGADKMDSRELAALTFFY